jgi:hypothetical protein
LSVISCNDLDQLQILALTKYDLLLFKQILKPSL